MPPPNNPIPPVPPGPPSGGPGPFTTGGVAQPPLGAPSQTPSAAAPGWQYTAGGTPSPVPSSGGGAGVKIAVVVAVLALIGLAAGAVLVLGGGDDDASPSATRPVDDIDDDPVAPATDAPAPTEAPASSEAPAASDAPASVPAVTEPAQPDTTAAPISVPEPVDLFSGNQARNMIAEVAEARGADPLRILRTAIYPTYSFTQVQDPSIPENVDEYGWRDGLLDDPAPVRLVGGGDLEANLFSDDEVRWKVIPDLVAGALDVTEIADGEVTHIIVQRNLPFSDQVVIRVYVNSPRKSGFIEADAQGNVIRVNVS